MIRSFCLLLVAACIGLTGCSAIDLDPAPVNEQVEPIMLRQFDGPSDYEVGSYEVVEIVNNTEPVHNDPFAEIAIASDTLQLRMSYEGGCEEHDFNLIAYGYFAETDPVQTGILLTHNDKEDSCREQISRTLRFDLSPLKGAFQESQGAASGAIVLNSSQRTEESGFPKIEYRF